LSVAPGGIPGAGAPIPAAAPTARRSMFDPPPGAIPARPAPTPNQFQTQQFPTPGQPYQPPPQPAPPPEFQPTPGGPPTS
jgi:hypothetical protein